MMNVVAEKKHAKLGPSGWDWWSRCPGAPALVELHQLPNKTSVYAAEGSVAHEIADKVLSGEIASAEDEVGKTYHCEGFDFVVDMEMADYVTDYVNVVHSFINVDEGDILMPEQRVPIGHLTGETDAEGTSDCVGITNGGTRLVVIDLKYGRGVSVSARENGQARMYALGALEMYEMIYEDIAEVEMVIVMPRIEEGVTSEILTVEQLREFADEVAIAAGRVDQNYQVDADALDLRPGEKQCKFCNAKGLCPALKAEVTQSLGLVTVSDPSEFEDLSLPKQASSATIDDRTPVEKLAEILRAEPLIEAFLAGARAEVERRLFAGEEVPGYYLGEGKKGHRKWIDEATVEEELKKRIGAKDTYVKKVISPTEAEKKFKGKPRTWAKIAPLITQSPGKPSVCKEGDKNLPYQLPSPADFDDLTAELEVDSEADALLS